MKGLKIIMSPSEEQKQFDKSNQELNGVTSGIAILVMIVSLVGVVLTWLYQNIITILLIIIGVYLLYRWYRR